MSGVLVVCHANICRSPLAAAALERSAILVSSGITSRGTDAHNGVPMCEVSEKMASALGIALSRSHRSQRLTLEAVRAADLILTAEQDQRRVVARLSPDARNRAFTVLEALGLAREVAQREPAPFEDLPDLVAALHGARGRSAPMDRLDVPDGHGLSRRRHRAATRDVAQAAVEFATLVDRLMAARPESR